jgi:uncharacterized delta-60 repeat protein/uncharacterized repeat protein (TIGR01451 family)
VLTTFKSRCLFVIAVLISTIGIVVVYPLGASSTSSSGYVNLSSLADGNIDSAFNAGGVGPNSDVLAVAMQSDGKIVISGFFTSYNGDFAASDYVMRLNADGTRDTTFNAGGAGANTTVYAVAVQPDGKILIAGQFTSYNGDAAASDYVMRLNADGTRDTTFNAGGSGANDYAWGFALQPDGKILVAGNFFTYNGNQTSRGVMRLNTDGTRDATFNAGGSGANGTVSAVAVQPDGKIVIAGLFTSYNGDAAASDYVMRLNSDGTRDTSFNPIGTGADNWVHALAVQSDGKIVIGGDFAGYNGDAAASDYVMRLNPDGTRDTNFNAGGTGADATVNAIAVQPDGKIIIGGLFTRYNGDVGASNYLIRLNTDGKPDTTFNPGGAGANALVYGLAVQPDERIVVGGQFTAYNGDFSAPAYVVRLLSTPTITPVCSGVPGGIISWWPGEGNAQDIVGHYDGALQNGATFGSGMVGQAFSLDGIDDAIVVSNNAALNPASITVEAWIKPNSVPAGTLADVVTKWGFDATVDSYFLGLLNSGGAVKVLGGIGDGATGDSGFSGGTVTLNTWNHIAMTYDAASGLNRLYLNGASVSQRVRANGIYPTTSRVFIGREDSNNKRFFSGLIDEPTIYSRALTDAEILAIYNAGGNGKCGASPKTDTNTSVSLSPDRSVYGQPVTFTAAVSSTSGSGTPTGTVQFFADGAPISGPQDVIDGVATLTTNILTVGAHVITATYSGDSVFNGSRSNEATQNVNTFKLPTTTAVTTSRNPSLTTAPPVFTATVASSAGLAPSGEVQFLFDGVAIGTSPVFRRGDQFVAVIGGASLDVAGSPHTITARYLGDSTHLPSDAEAMQQSVRTGTYFTEVIPGVPSTFTPIALNDAGLIVANVGNATSSRGALYDFTNGYRLLDTATAFAQVFDLNAAGTIVGRLGADAATTTGFIFGNGSLTRIGDSTAAVGVNGSDQVAFNRTAGRGAGLYDHGSVTVRNLFEARAINDAGVIAGSIIDRADQSSAALWRGGSVTELGTFGRSFATATHMANDGTVLVQGGEPSGEIFPLLWRDGDTTLLDEGRAWDISDAGVVVAGTGDARVYIGGVVMPLGTGSVAGMAINNLGLIAARISNQLRLWTPVPTSALSVNPVSGLDNQQTTLTATLTTNGSPAAGYVITFTLDGHAVGSATTGSNGVATLAGVSLCCMSVGVIPDGVRATFGGDRALGASAATAQLSIQAANPVDVAVTASILTPNITIGSNVIYFVTISNLGPNGANLLRLNVTLPAGLQYVSDTSNKLCAWTGGVGTCNFASLKPGSTQTINIVARPLTTLPLRATFNVSAAPQHDPNPANNTWTITIDAPPTVTINQTAGQTDPAIIVPLKFTVVFSEPVTGFTADDVSFAGSTVGRGGLAATVTGEGTTYTVSVSGMPRAGTVTVSIPAGAAFDSGGNSSAASSSTDNSILYGVTTVTANVIPSNFGNATVNATRSNGQIIGSLSYSRSSGGNTFSFTSVRLTSLVIDDHVATLQGFAADGRFFKTAIGDEPDTFRLWIEGVERTAADGAILSGTTSVLPWSPDTRLKGWVDLHTHPMSNLAFGGKLFHGAPSENSLMPSIQMPTDPQCRHDVRAIDINEALSQDAPTRGDVSESVCGDNNKSLVIRLLELAFSANHAPVRSGGYPSFVDWPKWDDITHQKMWIDWIRRAWQGGQRVMVALSHHNHVMSELLGPGGQITGVNDDRASSDLQVAEIARMVDEHPEFMKVARSPEELHAIVEGGRLAIVLGVEIDKIGNFNVNSTPIEEDIDNEIGRLYDLGVRYIFPIHVIDNAFGDTALYQSLYNFVNLAESGHYFSVGCADYSDEISYHMAAVPGPLDLLFIPLGIPFPTAPICGPGFMGHTNIRMPIGLTSPGQFAIRAMMRRGMLIDVDHMSNRAVNETLSMAAKIPGGGYPLNSGHSGVRDRTTENHAENARTKGQLAQIACLGGMFGLGSDSVEAYKWAGFYETGYNTMLHAFAPNGTCPSGLPLGDGFMGLGTDANSLIKTPPPPFLPIANSVRIPDIYNPDPNNAIYEGLAYKKLKYFGLPLGEAPAGLVPLLRSTTGTKTWDYRFEGVAHYGMYVDFLRDVRTWNAGGAMSGRKIVDDQMMYGAEYFYQMWLKADTQKARVP